MKFLSMLYAKAYILLYTYGLYIVILFIVGAGSYMAFREWYYFGTLTLYITEENTSVRIEGGKEHLCTRETCSLPLFPSTHTIEVVKAGFIPYQFSIEIPRNTVVEKVVKLSPQSVSLSVLPASSPPPPILSFPALTAQLVGELPNFEIAENTLLFQKTPLLQNQGTITVSTDEVGRNAWIITEEGVKAFSMNEKRTTPILEDTIAIFSAQKDGSFLWSNAEEPSAEIFHYSKGKNSSLSDISPISFRSVCVFPRGEIGFLQQKEGDIILSVYDKQSKTTEEKTIIENIFPSDIEGVECTSQNSFTVFRTQNSLLLTW